MLAWICLVVVASATAYRIQLTAAVMVASPVPADQGPSRPLRREVLIDRRVPLEQAQLLHGRVLASSRVDRPASELLAERL
jgi:hypothetical protein